MITKYLNYTQTFQLQMDASDVGVGAVLSQGGEDDQPIVYLARSCLIEKGTILQWRRNV